MQVPGPSQDWLPLAPSQFLAAAVSTALTIPSPLTQVPPVKTSGTVITVAYLFPQISAYWLRTDGNPAVANPLNALLMQLGDYRIVYGIPALRQIRVIADAPGGSLAVEYYLYRLQPEGS